MIISSQFHSKQLSPNVLDIMIRMLYIRKGWSLQLQWMVKTLLILGTECALCRVKASCRNLQLRNIGQVLCTKLHTFKSLDRASPTISLHFCDRFPPYFHFCVLGHLYADDVHAYLHSSASNATAVILAMIQTLSTPEARMQKNRLWITASKTQFIWLGIRQQLVKLDLEPLLLTSPIWSFPLLFRTLELCWTKSSPSGCYINLQMNERINRTQNPGIFPKHF